MRIRRQSVLRLASAVSILAMLGVMVSASGRAGSPQAGAATPFLFNAALASARDTGAGPVRTDRAVVRSRPVSINLGVLREADSPIQPVGHPATITLNLFDDVTLTAILDRVDETSSGFVWVGHVAGVDMSTVTLASIGDVVAGSISTGDAFYTIQFVGNGLHEVRQVDQSKYLRELEPRAPLPSRAADARTAQVEAAGVSRDDGSLIDVLVLYTAAAEESAGGATGIATRINLGISETNTSFVNSDVTPRLHLAGIQKVSYTEDRDLGDDLTALSNSATALGTTAASLRDSYGADLVMLITSPSAPNACGIAYHMATVSNGFAPSGFSVVEQSCISPSYSFAHELGHNMGGGHDWYVDNGITPHTYAHGYVDTVNRFYTVMAYPDACDDQKISCSRLLNWSNPLKNAPSGHGSAKMGVAGGTKFNCPMKDATNMACDADDHRTLNETALTVANFRQATTSAAPVVTSDPSTQTVAIGSSASFTAAAAGNPTPTVQWQVSTDGGTTWTDVSGATGATYGFTVSLGDHLKPYRAVFTNATGTATTKAAVLKVQGAPLVTTNPLAQTVISGAAVTFSVVASGTPAPTLQWQVRADGGATWSDISGATSTTYSFTAGSSDHLRQFRVVFTNSQGVATSPAATLTLQGGPLVIVQPGAATAVAGSPVAFQAMASGVPTPTVQWQVSSDGGTTWTDVGGATGATHRFTAAAADSLKQYRAVFTNSVSSATSEAALLTVRTATGQFIRSMQLPEGGRIRAFAIDPGQPQLIYAATWSAGVYRSVDEGVSWLPVLTHKGKFDVEALAIDPQSPNIVYAGTTAGLYKSTDRGSTWSIYGTGLNFLSVAVDPQSSLVLYAGTNGTGARKSTDGGVSWTAVLDGQIDAFVSAVAVDPRDSNRLFFGSDVGMWASADSGSSWTKWTMVARSFAFDPRNPGVMYVTGDGVYRSTDNGENFTRMSIDVGDGMYDLSMAIDPSVSTTIYVGSYTGLWKSTDSGATWTAFGLAERWGIKGLAVGPAESGVIYAGTNGAGLQKSRDGGATWAASNTGMSSGGVHGLSVDPRNPRTVLAVSGTSAFCGIELFGSGGNGVWRSSDGGTTWSRMTSGLTAYTITAIVRDPANPDVVYVGGGSDYQAAVFRSSDGGSTWTSVSTGLPTHGVMTLMADSRTTGVLYAGTYGDGVFKTTDSGGHWTAVNNGLTSPSVFGLGADPLAADTFYAGTGGDGVFKTSDGGAHWTMTGTGARTVLGFAFDPAHAGVLFAAGWVDGIYTTADGGATWVAASGGPTSVTALGIDPANAQTFYAASYDDGLFTSTDAGVTWTVVDASVQPVTATAIAIPPSTSGWLYVGSENAGVFAAGTTSTNWHPADTSGDGRLSISEITAYGAAWKKGTVWWTGPNPIPIGYVTRAGYLWRNGETYQRGAGECPACWATSAADALDKAASVWKVSFDGGTQPVTGVPEVVAGRR